MNYCTTLDGSRHHHTQSSFSSFNIHAMLPLHSHRRRFIPTHKTHHSCWEPRIYHPDLICDFIYPFHLSVLQRTTANKKRFPDATCVESTMGLGWRNQGSEKLQPQISSPRLTARKLSAPKTPERQRKSLFGTPQRERDSSRYVHFFCIALIQIRVNILLDLIPLSVHIVSFAWRLFLSCAVSVQKIECDWLYV